MDSFHIEKSLKNLLRTLVEGIATVKADCATKSRSDYRRELTIMGNYADYSVLTLALGGAMTMLYKISDGKDYKTDWYSAATTVFYANTVRIVARFDEELQQMNFVFTDRQDEASTAAGVAAQALDRIMSLG